MSTTIFFGAATDVKIVRDEIFVLCLSVSTFEEEQEAARMANDTIFGLGASVWTEELAQAHRLSRALKAGTVSVNIVVDVRTPFGGFKQSGNGRDLSPHAFEKYTETKTTWIRLR
ncbi:aldehyde dehydrogenase family protein [Mesorhizobium sp. M1339]|uniref:aldehyde dehydrogenase family protein n=1 Tax=Mesorhizobium sp. M1339 TaxID=2957086 RepID=UPI00333C9E82